MTLTNRQLAENETWITAETWLECPFCGFLSQDLGLDKPAVPCPYCSQSGRPRIIFPGVSSGRLLGMISHFYSKAWERVDDTKAALADTLRLKLSREHPQAKVVEAALRIRECLRHSDGSQEGFERLLGEIRVSLDLQSREALSVYVPLAQYSDTDEEHQVVVLLTAAMFEKLFGELLLRMFVKSGKDWEKARGAVRAMRGHKDRERVFAGIGGVGFEEAITKSGVSGFYARWHEVRELRNKFMHGMPFAIHVSDTEKAFELAKDAFPVFAHLHNRFCVTEATR